MWKALLFAIATSDLQSNWGSYARNSKATIMAIVVQLTRKKENVER